MAEMQAAGFIKPVYHTMLWTISFVIVNITQFDKHGKPKLYIYLDPSNLN